LWVPFIPKPVHQLLGNWGLRVLALLQRSTALSTAERALDRVATNLAAAYPDVNAGKHVRS
jgi:hypothetical protein